MDGDEVDLLLSNLYARYYELQDSVSAVLSAAVGDMTRTRLQIHAVVIFRNAFEYNQHLLSHTDQGAITRNLDKFVRLLTEAGIRCLDPPQFPPPIRPGPRETVASRGRGRPRIYLDPALLEQFIRNGYTATQIAPIIGHSCVRTIRRRLLELNLVEPGHSPFQYWLDHDGNVFRTHHPTRPVMSPLDDYHLDRVLRNILSDHPFYGRIMLLAALRVKGHRISRERVETAYVRVHGMARPFHRRTIVRTSYYVAGANSVWHMDGNHNLIRWKMVLHLFIDGKSRVVTGLGVHGNNRSLTVLNLFLSTHAQWGVPNRLRGDHGVENVKPAAWMQAFHGLNQGAYIWGKSTHNTRVERVWNDTSNGFSNKWKLFFQDLERYYGLNPDNGIHIWLLHHLFLNSINLDAQFWKATWNLHKLSLKGRRNASPTALWFESQMKDGVRGFDQRPLPTFIDGWDLRHDIDAANDVIELAEQGLADPMPQRLNYVECDPEIARWDQAAVEAFDAALNLEVRLRDTKMANRTEIWMDALAALPLLHARFT